MRVTLTLLLLHCGALSSLAGCGNSVVSGRDASGADALVDVERSNDASPVDSQEAASDASLADGQEVADDASPVDSGPPDMPPNGWRSVLYPEDWQPGDRDSHGQFLPDFSYAGYQRGEKQIPDHPPGLIYDVTKSPYGADDQGSSDATSAIQNAIDDAQSAGGGVVYLPEGTYRIDKPPLRVTASNMVIRGAGPQKTKLYMTKENNRKGHLLYLGKVVDGWKEAVAGTTIEVAKDVQPEEKTVELAAWPSPFPFQVGDTIIVSQDVTAAFISDHDMQNFWGAVGDMTASSKSARWPRYHRTVMGLDSQSKQVTLDIPIRYLMKIRDNVRVYRPAKTCLREVGVESLGVGMKQHSASGRIPSSTDYKNPDGTGAEKAAYEIYESHAVTLSGVLNGWVRNVETFKPPQNKNEIHIHSRGITLLNSRNITVADCVVKYPQSRTGGGNGYLYRMDGAQENLVTGSTAVGGRHNFAVLFFTSSGLVFHDYTSRDGLFPSDTHQHLSPSLLVDSSHFSGALNQRWGVSFRNRKAVSSGAGITSSQSVIWNAVGESRYEIAADNAPSYISRPFYNQQHNQGYVIGTSGPYESGYHPCRAVPSDPDYGESFMDNCRKVSGGHIEGIGKGDTLFPSSLYLDQRRRRIGR